MLLIVHYLFWKEMEQASYCYKYYHVGPLEKKANRDNYSMGQISTALLQKFFSEPKVQKGLLVVLVNRAPGTRDIKRLDMRALSWKEEIQVLGFTTLTLSFQIPLCIHFLLPPPPSKMCETNTFHLHTHVCK